MSNSEEAAELPINSEPSAETKESELTADVSQDNFEPQECSARQENENSANLSAEVLAHRKSIETLQQELYNLKEAVSCSRTRESRGTESWKGDALMFCRHENYSQPCTQSKSPETYMHGEKDMNHYSVFEMEKKIESLESELRRVTDLCTARVQESVELLHSKDVELERLEAELHRTIRKSPNDTRLVNYCAGQEKTSESRTAERITELARKVLQANRDRERQEARIQELQCTLHNLEQDRNLLLKRLREHEKKLEDSLSERSTERNHFENTLKEAHRELHIARETYQKFAEFFFKTGEKSLSASNPTQHSEHKPVTSDLSATESSRVNREASSSPSKANPSEISTEKLIMMQNEEGCIDFQEPNVRSKVHLPPNHNRIEHDAYSPSSVLQEQRRYQQEIQALQEKYQQSIDRITTDLKARMLSQQELRDAEIARLQQEVHSVQCERDTALQESIQSQIELQALRGKFLELEKKAAENEREASNKKLVTEQLKDEREAHRSTLMNLAQQKISFEKEIKDLKQQVSELKFRTNSP